MARPSAPKNPPAKKGTYQDYVSAMTTLVQEMKAGHLPSTILVQGTSEFLIGRTLKVLRDYWSGQEGSPPKGDWQTIEALEVDENKLAGMSQQSSLFDPASFFLIRRLEQAKSAARWLKTAPIIKPNSGTNHLCFVYEGTALPVAIRSEMTRLKVFEIPCTDPWPSELAPLVGALARKAGLSLQPDAVSLLIEAVGSDLSKLDNEISRLVLIFANSPQASHDSSSIAPYLDMLREDFVFELDNLLLQRRYAKAHALLTALLLRGESALALLGILSRHCRTAIRVHEVQNFGARGAGASRNPRNLAMDLRLPFTVVKSYTQYVAKTKLATFTSALAVCQEVDQKLKSSGSCEELLLGQVIEALARA
jgi:DNA polymerase III delta subunit